MPYNDLICFYHALVDNGLALYSMLDDIECFSSDILGFPNVCITNTNDSISDQFRIISNRCNIDPNAPHLLVIGPEVDKNIAHKTCSKYSFSYAGFWEDMEMQASELCVDDNHFDESLYRINLVDSDVLLDQCIKLVNRVLFPGKELSLGVMNTSLVSDNMIWFCIEEDNQVRSTLLLHINKKTNTAGFYMVCTNPEYQGRGLGQKLMLRAISYAYDQSCSKFILQSTKSGKRLYQKLGFRSLGLYALYLYRGTDI